MKDKTFLSTQDRGVKQAERKERKQVVEIQIEQQPM
jgi:hypothetical protein